MNEKRSKENRKKKAKTKRELNKTPIDLSYQFVLACV